MSEPRVEIHSQSNIKLKFCKLQEGQFSNIGLPCFVKTYKDHNNSLNKDQRNFFTKEKRWLLLSTGITDTTNHNDKKEMLVHPNLTLYLSLFRDVADRPVGIVTEWLPFTLRSFVKDRKAALQTVSLDFRNSILMDVIMAMRYLHAKGIAHRQLNPYNVFLTASLKAKVSNFYAFGPKSELSGEIPTLDYDKDKQEFSSDFLPPDYGKEFGSAIDYFSFGCLTLFTLTLIWPTPKKRYGLSMPDRPGSASSMNEPPLSPTALTELARREHAVSVMRKLNVSRHLHEVVVACLQDESPQRNDFKWIHGQVKDELHSEFQKSITDAVLSYEWFKTTLPLRPQVRWQTTIQKQNLIQKVKQVVLSMCPSKTQLPSRELYLLPFLFAVFAIFVAFVLIKLYKNRKF